MSWKAAAAVGLSLALCAAARGEAPPGRYTLATDTVRDNRTQLTWQRVAPAGRYTWDAAKTYCTGLTLAGQSGWRLPTRKELLSIVDYTRTSPAIDSVAFPTTDSFDFWSASPFAGPGGSAWYVAFTDGSSSHNAASNTSCVRCVR